MHCSAMARNLNTAPRWCYFEKAPNKVLHTYIHACMHIHVRAYIYTATHIHVAYAQYIVHAQLRMHLRFLEFQFFVSVSEEVLAISKYVLWIRGGCLLAPFQLWRDKCPVCFSQSLLLCLTVCIDRFVLGCTHENPKLRFYCK